MNLAGQGRCKAGPTPVARGASHVARGTSHLARAGQGGYAMAALLTMIAIMAVLLSALLPVWRHEMQREREAELAFRGEQYVHAIGLYFRKFNSYPPGIDVLVQQKFLRKKYKDPITGKDFRPVFAGQLVQQQQQRPGLAPIAQPEVRGGPGGAGGLVGVASTSDQDSIRIYKGRTKYSQWDFKYAGVTGRPGMQQPGTLRPGMPAGPGGRRPGGPGGPGGGGMGRPPGPGGESDQPPPGPRPRPFGTRPPGGE